MFFQFAGFFVFQTDLDVQRCRIVHIFRLALLNIVFALTEIIIAEMKCPLVCTILNRGNICKYIFETLSAEPFIGLCLQIEQMWHLQDFLRSGIGVSLLLANLHRSEHLAFGHSSPHPFISNTQFALIRKK